ncbi:MAG: hypothetical protein KBT27_05225 [Prevotellaceae bacterium]|nr:hypothetical protein [Candidatus Faecinaster equi]
MRNINIKWLRNGLVAIVTILGFMSCSDDHFDLDNNSAQVKGSLFDNLVATENCNDFINILSKTFVNKKEYGVPATLTYADLLKTEKSYTVWAPKDGSYDAQYWLKLLDSTELSKRNEIVETQFVKNHLTNFNYPGTEPTVSRLLFANNKYGTYDVVNGTIKDVKLVTDELMNVPASNGTIHVLEGQIPFERNLREFIDVTPELSNMAEYIGSQDTIVFYPESSTPGAVVDGKIRYVDSVFSEYNKFLDRRATNEDSLCVALYPDNNTWDKAIEKISNSYKFKDVYVTYDAGLNTYATDTVDADSLQKLYAIHSLFNNMYYSLYEQKNFDVENATVESVKNFFETSDVLIPAGYGMVELYHQKAPNCHELTCGKTPIKASNGYAFVIDDYKFKANESWQYREVVEAEASWNINKSKCKYISNANPTGQFISVDAANQNPEVTGRVSENAYASFVPTNNASNPVVAINLSKVLSGKYDIKAVIIPENITDPSITAPKKNKFTAAITKDYKLDAKGKVVETTVKAQQLNAKGKLEDINFESDVTKVDTITLFEDFEFEYTYLENSTLCPVLILTSNVKLADQKTTSRALNIDCIILEGKDE